MWPLPSSAAIPVGNPFAGMSLVEVLAVATILLAGALVFSFARFARARPDIRVPEIRVVKCPLDGTRARTLVRRSSTDAPLRIVYCSKWRVRTMTCDRGCLPKAA